VAAGMAAGWCTTCQKLHTGRNGGVGQLLHNPRLSTSLWGLLFLASFEAFFASQPPPPPPSPPLAPPQAHPAGGSSSCPLRALPAPPPRHSQTHLLPPPTPPPKGSPCSGLFVLPAAITALMLSAAGRPAQKYSR
jgi:hypothetical protein